MSIITFNPLVFSQQPWSMRPWEVIMYQGLRGGFCKMSCLRRLNAGEVWHKARTTTERKSDVTWNLSSWDADNNCVLALRNRISHEASETSAVSFRSCGHKWVIEPLNTQMSDKSDISVQRVFSSNMSGWTYQGQKEKEWLQIFIFHPWPVIRQAAFLTFSKCVGNRKKSVPYFELTDWS